MQAGQEPPNKGRTYPAEVLTADEVQALIGSCSARSASGIRNRALIALLYRSGLRVSEIGCFVSRAWPGRPAGEMLVSAPFA
jgi:site-specific recombinase XerD